MGQQLLFKHRRFGTSLYLKTKTAQKLLWTNQLTNLICILLSSSTYFEKNLINGISRVILPRLLNEHLLALNEVTSIFCVNGKLSSAA